MSHWPVTQHPLNPPPLSELASTLALGLQNNFKHVSAEVVTCPDLRLPPFHLAASGLSGDPRIADIGGPANLHPLPRFDRKYSLPAMMKLMEMPNDGQGFVLGAGAGPFHVLGGNSELMVNLFNGEGETRNLSWFARVDSRGKCGCERMGEKETDCALMANLFGCDGHSGSVIKIVAKGRSGDLSFTEAIQDVLREQYGEQTISMGGVFLIRRGKAKIHVMPDFSPTPLEGKDVLGWLRFFEVEAPLVCLTVFHSHDPGLGLRMEHTHCFSEERGEEKGVGGHYHNDTTPEEVVYEAYLNTAGCIYRIDRPA